MIEKNQSVIKLIKIINNTFGDNTFFILDDWEDLNSIGFKKNNKLIYICIYGKNDYFYECELLFDTLGKPPEIQRRASVNTKKELIEVMRKFFEIEKSN